jgi:hypothetical protein
VLFLSPGLLFLLFVRFCRLLDMRGSLCCVWFTGGRAPSAFFLFFIRYSWHAFLFLFLFVFSSEGSLEVNLRRDGVVFLCSDFKFLLFVF